MTSITVAQICDAVKNTLATAPILARAMSYNQLTEGINDTPTLQVYWDNSDLDPSGNADRTTFKAGVRQTNVVIFCDYYARQRKHIGEDMAALVNGIDAMTAIFEVQDTKPYFGLDGIKAFHVSPQHVTFEYGETAIKYTSARFTLTIRVF